jgi:Tfp pilus assembly protein PilF
MRLPNSKSTRGHWQDGRSWPVARQGLTLAFLLLTWLVPICASSQEQEASEPADWSVKVKKYSEAQEWTAALHIIDREMARAPKDIDIHTWRARVLAWSGKLVEAEHEYLEIVNLVPQDPDNWAGLASVYLARHARMTR